MGEGVFADDRLVELHRKARDLRHPARDVHDLGGVHPGLVGHDIVAHLQRHHHLFQRGVAGALAQPVDRALDLACARLDGGQCVGRGHAEIVVAMGGKDHLVGARHLLDQHPNEVSALARRGIAHGIGNIDRGRPRLDRDLDHPAEIIMLGPGRVHRRPLHVIAQVAGMAYGVVDQVGHLVHRQVRNLPVQRRGADEGVDARLAGVFHRLPATVDILVVGAAQPADHGVFRPLGNLAHRVEIAFRGNRKTGLDDIDTHLVEQLGDLELFLVGHGRAGRLLAVAQCRVENQDAVLLGWNGHMSVFLLILAVGLRARLHHEARDEYPLSARAKGHAQRRLRRSSAARADGREKAPVANRIWAALVMARTIAAPAAMKRCFCPALRAAPADTGRG